MWWVLAGLLLLGFLYAAGGRDYLKQQLWTQSFYNWIEPTEIRLFGKSHTLLKARLQMLTGLLLTFATQLGSLDITPLMPLVPDDWEPAVRVCWNMLPLVITIFGWWDEHLRKTTNLPAEIVAVPEAKVTPEMAAVVDKVKEAVAEAKVEVKVVAAVAEAKKANGG
jgi:hypothetical protein